MDCTKMANRLFREEDLTPIGRAYIAGMKKVRERLKAEKADCERINERASGTFGRMAMDLKAWWLEGIIEDLNVAICEAIVAISQEEAGDSKEG